MRKKKMMNYVLIAGISLSAMQLTGCASNASSELMTYSYKGSQKPANVELVKNINVSQVVGGHETNPLWASKINNENFKVALEQSLKNANLYNEVNKGNFQLNANLVKLEQPLLGFNLTVTCQVHYKLQNVKSNSIIYDKDITTSYTAKLSDSFVAIERLKMANEGAARANIQKLIDDLYRLKK